MAVEHRDITDPNIHEPKGVAIAASGTLYVANGGGTGSWRFLGPRELNNTDASFNTAGSVLVVNSNGGIGEIPGFTMGSMRFGSNSTALTLDNTGYTTLSGSIAPWSAYINKGVTSSAGSGSFTVQTGGIYRVDANFKIDAFLFSAVLSMNLNISPATSTPFIRAFPQVTGAAGAVSLSSIVKLNAGDICKLEVISDDATSYNLTFRDGEFDIVYLGPQ